MQIRKLLVEGELDQELLTPVTEGKPVVELVGGKGSIVPRARWERKDKDNHCVYIRDRDFDYEPDVSVIGPIEHKKHNGSVLGWHWNRHELENYMIDPAIVTKAVVVAREDYENALIEAGLSIIHYQAACWAVGKVRSKLPPSYKLETHPTGIDRDKFQLPTDCSEKRSREWLSEHVGEFRTEILPLMEPTSLSDTFESRNAQFLEPEFMTVENILLWFSGKDLLAALGEWLNNNHRGNPGDFRKILRDWMMREPDRVLELLEEWKNLVAILKV